MNRRRILTFLVSAGLIAAAASSPPAAAQQAGPERSQGVQVLTRGPVHEAFAEIVTYNPKPGVVIPKQPPAAILERPPEQKPAGENVVWIPGYWAWDDERSDFLWVSGVWRNVPPGRQWVPGYWAPHDKGFQWIAGYWTSADTTDVEYLPEPPASVEAGPNVEPASEENVWVPGNWSWQTDRYAWNPGYWCIPEPGWSWVPSRYIWTPRGCIFAGGYWDYPIVRRGVLFAPVHFTQPLYTRGDFRYSPAIAVATHLLTDYLFCRPSYGHYYFGDYFAPEYGHRGIYPWFAFSHSRIGYDPIYAYQRRVHLKNDPDWERRIEANFHQRQRDVDSRPPRTLAAMQQRAAANPDQSVALAAPMSQLAKNPESSLRLQAIDPGERQQLGKVSSDVKELSAARQKLETEQASKSTQAGAKASKPTTAKLPHSPLGAKTGNAVPQTEKAPQTERVPQTEKARKDPAAPKAVPRTERPPAPKAEPRPKPRAEPRPEPKATPRPESRAEPRPTPRPESRPTPRSEPAPRKETRPSGGGERSKDRDR